MVRIARILRDYSDAGGLNTLLPLWGFVDGAPKTNRFRSKADVPAETEVSRAISKELASRGFKFCGPTIVYAFMQATGMVNDHILSCHRHDACAALAGTSPFEAKKAPRGRAGA